MLINSKIYNIFLKKSNQTIKIEKKKMIKSRGLDKFVGRRLQTIGVAKLYSIIKTSCTNFFNYM